MIGQRVVDAHTNGDCGPLCPVCDIEDSLQDSPQDSLAWTCDLHGITTTGDCPRCDDELIAMHEGDDQ